MIVFLNGASSSGKTSLARELQAVWNGPLLYWGIDTVMSQLPFRYTGEGADAEAGFPLRAAQDGGWEVGYGEYGLTLNELSADYLAALARRNLDVVADFVLLDQKMLEPYRVALAEVPVLFVGLYCDAGSLSERNRSRQDRVTGLSVNQQAQIHFCEETYDLQLNSTNHTPRELAASIVSHLQHVPPTPGFSE